MKPEDLTPPYTWAERRVCLHDRVWYVPTQQQVACDFAFAGWQAPEFFGNDQPVIVEYCCGNGAWIAAKAAQHPELNWIGVEKRFDRVRKVWSKIHNQQLPNLIVLCGEALDATQRYFPAHSVAEVYVNFPDPWPKRRHAKNRLLQGVFVDHLHRILRPTGSVVVATDDAAYSGHLMASFRQFSGFRFGFPEPGFVTHWPDYGDSYFDALWREQGRTIRYHRFERI